MFSLQKYFVISRFKIEIKLNCTKFLSPCEQIASGRMFRLSFRVTSMHGHRVFGRDIPLVREAGDHWWTPIDHRFFIFCRNDYKILTKLLLKILITFVFVLLKFRFFITFFHNQILIFIRYPY